MHHPDLRGKQKVSHCPVQFPAVHLSASRCLRRLQKCFAAGFVPTCFAPAFASDLLTSCVLAAIPAFRTDDSPVCTPRCWFGVVTGLQITGQGASLLGQSSFSIWLCWKPFTVKKQESVEGFEPCPPRRDPTGFSSSEVQLFFPLNTFILFLSISFFKYFFSLLPSYTLQLSVP